MALLRQLIDGLQEENMNGEDGIGDLNQNADGHGERVNVTPIQNGFGEGGFGIDQEQHQEQNGNDFVTQQQGGYPQEQQNMQLFTPGNFQYFTPIVNTRNNQQMGFNINQAYDSKGNVIGNNNNNNDNDNNNSNNNYDNNNNNRNYNLF